MCKFELIRDQRCICICVRERTKKEMYLCAWERWRACMYVCVYLCLRACTCVYVCPSAPGSPKKIFKAEDIINSHRSKLQNIWKSNNKRTHISYSNINQTWMPAKGYWRRTTLFGLPLSRKVQTFRDLVSSGMASSAASEAAAVAAACFLRLHKINQKTLSGCGREIYVVNTSMEVVYILHTCQGWWMLEDVSKVWAWKSGCYSQENLLYGDKLMENVYICLNLVA